MTARKQRRTILLALALAVIFAGAVFGHRVLGESPVLASTAEPVEVTVYVHDATGGCPNSLALCNQQDIVDALDRRYRGYLEDAGLTERVTLEVKNLRMEIVKAEAKSVGDPELDAHLLYPYPLFVMNGTYRVNMDKSRASFYAHLLEELTGRERAELEQFMEDSRDAAATDDVILYFYREESPVHGEIEGYLAAYDASKIERYDLSDPANEALYKDYVAHYPSIDDEVGFGRMEPAVFVNDAYLQGPIRIRDYFAEMEADKAFETLRP